jgi:hypothetical protein
MNIPDHAGSIEKRDAAFELKFLLPKDIAEAALAWARHHLSPDPHAQGAEGDGYRVNSLYFETPRMDVYLRNGSYGKSKYRVRRYGNESSLFLERKLKSRGLVSKRRTRVPDRELVFLDGAESSADWGGRWFRRRLEARRLLPKCQITYQRVARIGTAPEGPVRLTVDDQLRCFLSGEYQVSEEGKWVSLLPDRCILELKYRVNMPQVFQVLVDELALKPQPISKYRLAIQAFGLDPQATGSPASNGNGHVAAEELPVLARAGALEMPG